MPDAPPGPRGRAWWRWLRWAVLAAGGGYFAIAFGVYGWRYLELKVSMSEARAALLAARWEDPELRCGGGARLGPHFGKLFGKPEIFVTRILWDQRPPRLEFYVSGMAAPRDDVQPRHLLMTVELMPDGEAVPTAAVLAGENDRLESARVLLKAACAKQGDSPPALTRPAGG